MKKIFLLVLFLIVFLFGLQKSSFAAVCPMTVCANLDCPNGFAAPINGCPSCQCATSAAGNECKITSYVPSPSTGQTFSVKYMGDSTDPNARVRLFLSTLSRSVSGGIVTANSSTVPQQTDTIGGIEYNKNAYLLGKCGLGDTECTANVSVGAGGAGEYTMYCDVVNETPSLTPYCSGNPYCEFESAGLSTLNCSSVGFSTCYNSTGTGDTKNDWRRIVVSNTTTTDTSRPTGFVDASSCSAGSGGAPGISGWAKDADYSGPIPVDFWLVKDTDTNSDLAANVSLGSTIANITREAAVGVHGFNFVVPTDKRQYFTTKARKVSSFGINVDSSGTRQANNTVNGVTGFAHVLLPSSGTSLNLGVCTGNLDIQAWYVAADALGPRLEIYVPGNPALTADKRTQIKVYGVDGTTDYGYLATLLPTTNGKRAFWSGQWSPTGVAPWQLDGAIYDFYATDINNQAGVLAELRSKGLPQYIKFSIPGVTNLSAQFDLGVVAADWGWSNPVTVMVTGLANACQCEPACFYASPPCLRPEPAGGWCAPGTNGCPASPTLLKIQSWYVSADALGPRLEIYVPGNPALTADKRTQIKVYGVDGTTDYGYLATLLPTTNGKRAFWSGQWSPTGVAPWQLDGAIYDFYATDINNQAGVLAELRSKGLPQFVKFSIPGVTGMSTQMDLGAIATTDTSRPTGFVDASSCSAGSGGAPGISGWAKDADYSGPIPVDFWLIACDPTNTDFVPNPLPAGKTCNDYNVALGSTIANITREAAVGAHGFNFVIPTAKLSYFSTKARKVSSFGINVDSSGTRQANNTVNGVTGFAHVLLPSSGTSLNLGVCTETTGCTTDTSCTDNTAVCSNGSCVNACTAQGLANPPACKTYQASNHACNLVPMTNGTVCNMSDASAGVCQNGTCIASTGTGLANVQIKLKFQGISTKKQDETVQIVFKNALTVSNQIEYQDDALLIQSNDDGSYMGTITGIKAGTYDIYIKGWAHLRHKFANVTITDPQTFLDFRNVTLKAGDIAGAVDLEGLGIIKGDNFINIIDIGKLVDDYMPNTPEGSLADFNLDGVVNIIDLGLLIDNYDTPEGDPL